MTGPSPLRPDGQLIDPALPFVRAFAPGRTEVAGNHTDHQGGKTVSAAVEQGISVLLQQRPDNTAVVRSTGYGDVALSLENLQPVADERGSTAALVRGVCAGLAVSGVPVAGFSALVESDIDAGGGLSSSAAFELALAKGLDVLFGNGSLPTERLAGIGCEAEREHFGKPCGLQDQTAIAHGGVSLIDYREPGKARVEALDADFDAAGLCCVLVRTRCDHSAHTAQFAQLVEDMRAVAGLLGVERLGDACEKRLFEQAARVRAELGDRAFLRALHYYNEMDIVEQRVRALRAADYDRFLALTNMSGASSAELLGNVLVPGSDAQDAMVVLGAAQRFMTSLASQGMHGACRIHGGGFGGSVQAFVPRAASAAFVRHMERIAGSGCCLPVRVSREGARAQWENR